MNDKNTKSSALFTPSGCLTVDALMLFVSGSLENTKFAEAEQHIAECPLCADAADGLRMWLRDNTGEFQHHIHTRTQVISKRIKQRLHTDAIIEGAKTQRLSVRPAVWFSAAAAILLLMGISFVFWIQNQNNTKLQAQKQLNEKEAIFIAQTPEALAYPPSNSNAILDIKYIRNKGSHIPPAVSIVFEDVAMTPERARRGGPNAGNRNDESEYIETRDKVESDVFIDESGENAKHSRVVKNGGGTMNKSESEEETTSVFISVQQMPSFPGGDAARINYLAKNLRYPAKAAEDGIQGIIYVSFIVKTDGRITDVKLLRGIGGGCDEEAIRVVAKMPQWNPGLLNGKKVDVRYNMPVRFKLQ